MLDLFENVISGFLKTDIVNMCDLETVDDKYTFVATDGSMMTLIEYSGLLQIPGEDEYKALTERMSKYMTTSFGHGGHGMQFVFFRDPAGTRRHVSDVLRPAKETLHRIGLDADDLIEDKVSTLSTWCAYETCYVALWTYPSSLPSGVQKRHRNSIKEASKNRPDSIMGAMDPYVLIPDIRNRHHSFVSSFSGDLSRAGVLTRVMEVHEASRAMRMQLDPEFTAYNWRPSLPGKGVLPSVDPAPRGKANESGLLLKPLSSQLISRGHHNHAHDEIRVGSRYFTPILLETYPQDLHTFASLFARVNEDIPWRISFHLSPGNLGSVPNMVKRQLAMFFTWAGATNRMIKDEFNDLQAQQDAGATMLGIRTVIVTWARSPEKLRANVESLSQAVQEWGLCDVMTDSADPSESIISSAPGISHTAPASMAWGPVDDIVHMLPTDRPASSWSSGSVLYRTQQNTIWPYEPGSSLQTAIIDLIFATPGSGKSVMSNSINTSLCMQAGRDRLPRISTIDIGPSARGGVNLIRDSLPEDQKYLALHHKMVMSEKESINPFDLQLGARVPTPLEKGYQVNLLTLLATPAGRDKPYENMPEMISMVVDEVYRYFHPDVNPKIYTANVSKTVDALIQQHKIEVHDDSAWYEVADEMMRHGEVRAATIAQRFAVPLLSDVARIVHTSKAIQSAFGQESGVTAGSNGKEALADAFNRMISDAIRNYPIFKRETRVDFGNARIIALDLDDVAKEGGAAADKQTAVCYMLARHLVAGDFYVHEKYLDMFGPLYYEYQRRRIQEIREDVKRLIYDEFHRTKGQRTVRNQVVVDIREGRKWGVQVCLISQELDDFDSQMYKMSTNNYIMGTMTAAAINDVVERFGLTPSEEKALRRGETHGPVKGGSAFLFKYATKRGWRSQILRAVPGPRELWAYSTTPDDSRLREVVTAQTRSAKLARSVLAHAFPSGSAEDAIAAARAEMDGSVGVSEGSGGKLFQTLAKDAIRQYRRHLNSEAMKQELAA